MDVSTGEFNFHCSMDFLTKPSLSGTEVGSSSNIGSAQWLEPSTVF